MENRTARIVEDSAASLEEARENAEMVFVEPAGRMFDAILDEAGVDRRKSCEATAPISPADH
ncbi:hypothetical protein [Manganibacter manganicus]|uniref:Uncharacterized protein n=1 Tax=Manganibacter manganicus TaxID=1873176 RepID=A0A1V8RNX0_9HYPH|nr:hypothetical protein [Pseudaminobacter manganicus]OQM74890.1 hypothetical protein BFN67_04540 [Pseudaminobacter manganicus]